MALYRMIGAELPMRVRFYLGFATAAFMLTLGTVFPTSAVELSANDKCRICRQSCTQAQKVCREEACANAGGQLNIAQCRRSTDSSAWREGVKSCEQARRTCWHACYETDCSY